MSLVRQYLSDDNATGAVPMVAFHFHFKRSQSSSPAATPSWYETKSPVTIRYVGKLERRPRTYKASPFFSSLATLDLIKCTGELRELYYRQSRDLREKRGAGKIAERERANFSSHALSFYLYDGTSRARRFCYLPHTTPSRAFFPLLHINPHVGSSPIVWGTAPTLLSVRQHRR